MYFLRNDGCFERELYTFCSQKGELLLPISFTCSFTKN